MTKEKKDTFKLALKNSVPVMAGYIVMGAGFGVLLQNLGLSTWWALLMSASIYAGSMQYVAIDLLSGGATLVSAAIMTLVVNIRHIFYGVSMLEKYKDVGLRKIYLYFSLTDETFSLLCNVVLPKSINKKDYYLFVSLLNQFYWILGGVLGAYLGSKIEFNSNGIEFAMTALFVIIFVEQWESTKQHAQAIIGVVISVICVIIFGGNGFLIPSMIGITVTLFLGRKFLEGGNSNE